nr:hypothetical protein [Tanacetum cinerariifolium]
MDLCTRLQRQQDEMASKITAQDMEIATLKAKIKHLEDIDRRDDDPSIEDATIKGRSVLLSGVQVSVPPAAKVATVSVHPATISVPTGSDVVPTASPIFTTATVTTPYSRRKEEELQIMIDGLDRNNETVAKYLQEYEQFATELSIEERIELISDLVKYQDNYAKVLKNFKGISLYEIREKFIPVWKQIEDFVLMGSKEEGERFKRKRMSLEQDIAKKVKTSEEVSEEDLKEIMQPVLVKEVYVEALHVKQPIIDWEIHTEGEISYWKIIRLGGSKTSYQFFVDMLKHFDSEDLNQLWALVKETLSIRLAKSDKEKELWVELKRLYKPDVEDQLWTQIQALMHALVKWRLYDSCGVHHILSRDQE